MGQNRSYGETGRTKLLRQVFNFYSLALTFKIRPTTLLEHQANTSRVSSSFKNIAALEKNTCHHEKLSSKPSPSLVLLEFF